MRSAGVCHVTVCWPAQGLTLTRGGVAREAAVRVAHIRSWQGPAVGPAFQPPVPWSCPPWRLGLGGARQAPAVPGSRRRSLKAERGQSVQAGPSSHLAPWASVSQGEGARSCLAGGLPRALGPSKCEPAP